MQTPKIKPNNKNPHFFSDLRVDYRLNSESSISAPLLNVNFSTNLTGSVDSVMCEPEAKWVAGNPSLGWNLLEISRNGDVHGSLKARIFMKNSGVGLFNCFKIKNI